MTMALNHFQPKPSDKIGQDSKRLATAKVLNQVLADSFAIYTKTLNYHWNVEGGKFIGIHELTDKQYHNLFEAIDEIGERIRALGFYTPGSMKAFLDLTTIVEADAGETNAQTMLEDLERDHMHIVSKLREGVAIAEQNNDSTTADMLSERSEFHEEAAWMLRSLSK
ncbi:Dps family protein [Pseudobacteriovorax antillogorgiicola]|uniref:Starvation-inducible DNA-binding protein n=1 Tax=Pseudobacteriovorax antillogorgiicola TaxID=1513793 RepID=A0A1Y6C2K9_9BACT|nr:DNA starvation/stationary phase protection protein [Pseudobacteriovorax antillogorgiicola]TCS50701.1 starvation-inducible DNA-binding protein [Pseudobacteriovorax antillogorgiicola]SMF40515.1 starvation-inducible DNA-binding protein [Pseudobacteriovorax antillogorgiicola]